VAPIIERIGSGCTSNLMRVLIRLTAPVFEEISMAFAPSSFKANDAKTVEPCEVLSVFNCDLSMGRAMVLTEGIAEFCADC